MTDTPMIDAAAQWFARWLGAPSVRDLHREHARDLVHTILAAAQPSSEPDGPAPAAATYTMATGYTGPAPAAALPGTVRGVGIAMQRLEMRVGHDLRELERRLGQLEDRVDEMQTPSEYDPADDEDAQATAQTLIDDATKAFAAADSSSERVEVIRDLLAGWYAAWPKSAVTDPHEPIAWQLVSLICAAEARASAPRQQLLAELTAGKRPCPWCTGAPVFDSAEELLTHTRRYHLAPFPPDELVWLGELSGYQVEPDGERLVVRHRCGWKSESVEAAHLANIISVPVAAHRQHGCTPTEADR